MRPFYTLAKADIGKAFIRAFGRTWQTSNFIGQVLPGDVGKRVYEAGDILQVENEEQRAARLATDAERVPVLFRADQTQRGGAGARVEITAVFPTLPGTVGDADSMTCYAHVGQHGTCSTDWYREKTRPAKPEEYKALETELQGLGYVLDIRERLTRAMHDERSAAAAPPKPPRTIEVWDERFAEPTRVGRHTNVPADWLKRDILERFGIGDHLAVYQMASDAVRGETIQRGKKRP